MLPLHESGTDPKYLNLLKDPGPEKNHKNELMLLPNKCSMA